VLGYDEERDIFVAWDATTHPNPSASASLQVPIETIEEAASTGFAGRERSLADGTPEVVVAFRPELVATYLNLIPAFHVTREDEGEATASAARGVERPLEELPGNVEQRRTIRKVARLVRDARFRDAVLRAYDRRCAFCGLGLGLVQAAHLRPVREEGADQVRNGVAACPTHHAAFDAGLVVIDDDFAIRVNSARLEARGTTEEDVARLAESLLDQLRLPEAEALRPAPENLLVHRKRWLEQ
jgi:putative restriction endonuclease